MHELRQRYPQEILELSGEHLDVDLVFHTILHSTILWNLTGVMAPHAPHAGNDLNGYPPSTSGHVTLLRHAADENRTRHVREAIGNPGPFVTRHSASGSVEGGGSNKHSDVGTNFADSSGVVNSGSSLYDALQSGIGFYNAYGNWTNLTGSVHAGGGGGVGAGAGGGGAIPASLGGPHSGYAHTEHGGQHLAQQDEENFLDEIHPWHTPQQEIAHKLHYASLAVLSVLLVEVSREGR
nr:hypothetical protein BaRGS_002649 [Batillaria attramentaria]